MKITYLGHSAFHLKGQQGTVVIDPYKDSVGMTMKKLSADVVAVSHQHDDHSAVEKVTSTARREHPFIIDAPGEYEVGGISVFGYQTYHDDVEGKERGTNIIYAVQLDDVITVHLGDLGHTLSESLIETLGRVDVLLCPVGGVYTIDPKKAVEVIHDIGPSYIVPMHFKTADHKDPTFQSLATLEDFLKAYGTIKQPLESLSVTAGSLPEETELVVLDSATTA